MDRLRLGEFLAMIRKDGIPCPIRCSFLWRPPFPSVRGERGWISNGEAYVIDETRPRDQSFDGRRIVIKMHEGAKLHEAHKKKKKEPTKKCKQPRAYVVLTPFVFFSS